MAEPFFTIGHSTRTIDEFLALVQESRVESVVDVRRLPGSKRHPQFDQDALASSLRTAGIAYHRAEGLTGRRPVSRDVPFETNAWWQNRSFHNYADHALSADFGQALDELRAEGRERRVTVMCSESVWWRCHRRIIADHLLARDEVVRHILGPGHVDPAELSAGAVVRADVTVTFQAA